MQYKNIFKLVFLLISSPAKAWEDICVKEDRGRVISDYVYPMIGFCGIAWFAGSIVRRGWSTPMAFQSAMIDCCGIAVALFGGFFLASFLINRYLTRWFQLSASPLEGYVLTGYAMTVIFIAHIVTGIYPNMQAIAMIVQLYTFVIVYEGAEHVMKLESQRMPFTIASSIVILGCPFLIEFIYQHLVTTLN